MRLINFLPPSSRFGHEAFQKWDKSRDERRLVLSNPHSLSAEFGKRSVEGSSDVSYVLQVPSSSPKLLLNTTHTVPLIGIQAPDLIRSITESYRPRTSIALSEVGNGLFDMRALAYVVGAAVACGSSNTPFPFASSGVSVKPLAPSWTVPLSDEVTLGPGLVTDDREFQTFSSLCRSAGVMDIQIMGDSIPNTAYKPYQGTKLGSLALKIFAYIMSSANACGCADHHFEAYFRGMTSVYSLWAHSDEGGWIRRCLATADYPPSSGVLASTAEEVIGISTRELLSKSEVTRVSVAMYLEMAGALSECDAWDTGVSTVLQRDPTLAEPRPGSFLGLRDITYQVMARWRDWTTRAYGVAKSLIMDTHSFKGYFDLNAVDSHLTLDTIVPFWWVEPGPLCICGEGQLFMPCRLASHVVMPLLRTQGVLQTDMPLTPTGTYAPGVPLRLVRSGGGLRDEGASYLLSSRYRRKNGLNHSTYVTHPSAGVHTTDAMFVAEGTVNAADRRWVTPHNPIPSPMEGYTDHKTCIEYTYMGGAEPTLVDWSVCKVTSFLGYFRVNNGGGESGTRTHRHVPGFLTHIVDPFSRIPTNYTTFRWFETPSADVRDIAPPVPVESNPAPVTPVLPQSGGTKSVSAPAAVPPPVEVALLADPESFKTPSIKSPTPTPPETLDTHPSDPLIRTTVSDTMGARPHVPTISQETKQPPKGEVPSSSESS